ncbi:PEP-CTERM sorting domain-containing protein [Mariniblastus sp.]|nr:PEP-CTERM sorting domain-containing protein [Mariniblastus sp.]
MTIAVSLPVAANTIPSFLYATEQEDMTHVFNKTLMMAALVAAFSVAHTATSIAQTGVSPTLPPTPTAGVGDAQAIVDLSTGEVFLDIGIGLQVFGLEGVPFDNAAAVNGLLIIDPLPFGSIDQGPGTQNDENGIGVLNTSFLFPGVFNLGAIILEDFRSEAALADLNFRFDGPANTDPANAIGDPGNITFVSLAPAIPEPGSLTLLALAGLGAVARRR